MVSKEKKFVREALREPKYRPVGAKIELPNYKGLGNMRRDVETTGYIQGKKSGVFAYISASQQQTLVADTWTPIEGTFVNDPIEDFSVVADPGIRYDGVKDQYFEIDWHATVLAGNNNESLCFGVFKNGEILTASVMHQFAKNNGEKYNCSGTVVTELCKDDVLQLVILSETTPAIITVTDYTTTISEFFD